MDAAHPRKPEQGPDRSTAAGEAVTRLLVADATLRGTAQRVADLACEATGATAARVTVASDGGDAETVAVTGALPEDAVQVPLHVGTQEVGALHLAGSQVDRAAAVRFADRAAVVLANARAYWTVREQAAGLQVAVDSRAVIDMAKGKLMAQGGVTPDEAFALLVKASQRENVKLREIAQRIVADQGQPMSSPSSSLR